MRKKVRGGRRAALRARHAFLAMAFLPGAALGCPDAQTLTGGDEDDPRIVLAEGPAPLAVRIAGPFDTPWSLAFLPDGSFFVTERPGRLLLIKPGGEAEPIAGTPEVLYVGHGGLLDVAIDPDFATNGFVYLSYLQGEEANSTLRVMRGKLDVANETLTEQQVIFESTPGPRPELLGGRLALTDNGYLFLTVGDRWQRDPAQDLADDLGSIIRIRTDGSIPHDNPFRYREGARPEIWSYGHRNPQGLAFNRATGELWEHEHGPQGGDELNLILPGRNYGWPLATYGVDYTGQPIAVNSQQPGTEQPVHYWAPISIAPSGLAVESQASEGHIWMGALAGEMLVELTIADHCVVAEKHLFPHQLGRIRDVRIDANGAVYVLTEGSEGTLYQLEPQSGEPAADSGEHL
jgi:glucose/arabinose dehydrogenase